MAANLLRHRPCLYYFPWWFLLSLVILVTAIGVWIPYSDRSADSANDAINTLNVSTWINTDTAPWQVYVAVAVVYLAVLVAMLAMTIARTAIEAKHDKTGVATAGGTAWLFFHIIFTVIWWLLLLWNVMMIAGIAIYLLCVTALRGALINILAAQEQLPTPPVWSGPPEQCPVTCLNYNYLTFLEHSDDNSCVCSYTQLSSAKSSLDDALDNGEISLGTACFMFLGALGILTNFMCQFSQMKVELDYLRRFHTSSALSHQHGHTGHANDVVPTYPMPVQNKHGHGDVAV